MYIPTEMKWKLMRFVVNYDKEGQNGGLVTIQSSEQIISSFSHIVGMTMGTAEEIYKVNGMWMDGIGKTRQVEDVLQGV